MLVYQLFTPSVVWGPPESTTLAINSQGGGADRLSIAGNQLDIVSADGQLRTTATIAPFDAAAHARLTQQYPPRMWDRDRDTALPFQRTVTIVTDGPDTPEQALFHATAADGIWWMLGGFLVDPGAGVHWGWRAWRNECTLPEHAADLSNATAAQFAALLSAAQPVGGPSRD
jgi:hypothetical protein